MSVMTRIRKLAESAWFEVTEHVVDSQRQTDGLHAAQPKQLQLAERLYEQTLQETISLREQQMAAAELAAKRAKQAELAMRAGEETLARLALQEKLLAEANGEQLRVQYAQCQDAVLALAEELQQLRTECAAACEPREYNAAKLGSEQQQKHQDLRDAAQDTLRELGIASREVGRDVGQALRDAGRISRETLQETGSLLKREIGAARSKVQRCRK
jgi:phage shock protein A